MEAHETFEADMLLLWFGQRWAPSEKDRFAFLKTAAIVMGTERCRVALEAWTEELPFEVIRGGRDA